MDTTIQILQPVTGDVSESLAKLDRLQRYEAICAKPAPWTSEELREVEQYETYLFELQMVNFRASIEAGDSEASRKAFFASDFDALNRAYELENAECRECKEPLDEDEAAKIPRDEHTYNGICNRCNDSLPPEFVAADYRR